MSHIAKPFVRTASLALLAGVAHGAVPEIKEQPIKDPPYSVILTRNAFGLKPPPSVIVETNEVGPPPNVKLTAVIAITSPKKAMFVVTPAGKANPIYLTVNEGEFSEDSLLKVLEIDEKNGSVKIVMNDKTSTLDFVNNGIKNAAVAMVPIPGGQPFPGAQPGVLGAVQPAGGDGRRPGGSGGGQFNPGGGGGGAPAVPANSLQPIPPRPTRLPSPQPQLGPAVPEKPLTVEQSVILKKVDELVNQDKIKKQQYPPALPIPELDP